MSFSCFLPVGEVVHEDKTNRQRNKTEKYDMMVLKKSDFDAVLGSLHDIMEKERIQRDREAARASNPKMKWADLQVRAPRARAPT